MELKERKKRLEEELKKLDEKEMLLKEKKKGLRKKMEAVEREMEAERRKKQMAEDQKIAATIRENFGEVTPENERLLIETLRQAKEKSEQGIYKNEGHVYEK